MDSDVNNIQRQSLWNNTYIKVSCDEPYRRRLQHLNIRVVNDLWDPNRGLYWEKVEEKGVSNKDWLNNMVGSS